MVKLSDILVRGYFPKELPPPFHTSGFANFIKKQRNSIPPSFSTDSYISKCAVHNLPRSGTLHRSLGIPNPVNYYRLALFIKKNWPQLKKHTSSTKISLTSPFEYSSERAIAPKHALQELPKKKAALRSRSKYILKADINRFYNSIYTHSIPWALHGKTKAKKDKSDDLIGNQIDRLVREGQDRQTIGIPIGPDISLLIAEIILSAVDRELEWLGIINGFRYIDDYEFGFQTLAEAEEALCQLQELLNKYELALNPNKTEIITLPLPAEQLAVSELRTFRFQSHSTSQYWDILHYFDKAFSFARDCPKDAVLRYAVSRIDGIIINKSNWGFCEDLFLQCAISEPGTVPFVLKQLLKYQKLEYDLNKDHISEVLNSIIEQHSPKGHGGDVVWALWGLLVFKKKLSKTAGNKAAKMKDPFVAILLCDAHDNDLVDNNTCWEYLASLMTTEDLKGEMWLFSYEANRRKWFNSVGCKNHVLVSPQFKLLKDADVSFYDEKLSNNAEPEEPEGGDYLSTIEETS
jgi:hypothetical protein